MFRTETLCDSFVKIGHSRKGRFKLMRAWSFHGKSGKAEATVKKGLIGSSTGSLDGDLNDSSSKAPLCDPVLDTLEVQEKRMFKSGEKMILSASKLSKMESLKEKKKSYRSQKKEVHREIMNSASDKSFVLMSDWLKVRGTLKGWTKLWCVCKPSMLLIYKSEKMKTGHWVGTILLNTCQLLQRPSKKEGFCFKLFHPLDQSIWATKGPTGETMGAFVQPLPVSYAIFRAPSQNQGKCWMDGLELALRCTGLIKRAALRANDITHDLSVALVSDVSGGLPSDLSSNLADDGEEGTEEQPEHFSDDDDHSSMGMSESDFELAEEDKCVDRPKVEETVYVCNEVEELGQVGDACQTEEVDEENKGLIWTLVKQVRPGMDLSKVVLPTFILEPRSFLDKLTDYYYHADILSQAVQQETALERMKMVVKWYLSGFYKKPRGLKKPYNPIIGETYRCYWVHPQTNSRTFYVAEQISHHPPISAFHVTNRQDGFNINGCILAKSKFYGNSISAILEGVATLTFLERGEDYLITMPYAHCKGILLGTLTMEMGGKVTLDCPKTGYHCDLDFKLKPFFGNGESANRITGCIRMGSEILCTFEGHWDQYIYIKELTNRESVLFWEPCPEVRARRLRKYTVPVDLQRLNESERLWQKVSQAVVEQDMHQATAEKHKLEEKQRSDAKERHRSKQEWTPKWFTLDPVSHKWIYKHADARPWDPMTDCVQYERDYIIKTQTVHRVPQVWQSPPMVAQGRVKAFTTPVTDDSYSSDNNAAESDDARCRNTNRKPSVSTPNLSPQEFKPHTKTSQDVTKCFYKTSPRSLPKKLTFNQSNAENKSKVSEQDNKHLDSYNTSVHFGGKATPSHQYHSENRKTPHHIPLKSSSVVPVSSPQSMPAVSHEQGSKSVGISRDLQTLTTVVEMQHEMHLVLNELMTRVTIIQKQQTEIRQSRQHPNMRDGSSGVGFIREWVLVAAILIIQTLLQWFFSR